VGVTLQQIKDKSEKNRISCDDILLALDKWRIQELEKIEQLYQHEMQCIEVQEGILRDFHRDLLEQLEDKARKPLEHIQGQENINVEIFNNIRQTIEKVRKESIRFEPNVSSALTVNSEYSPSDFSLMLSPVKVSALSTVHKQNTSSSAVDIGKKNQTNFENICVLYRR
jgi:HJR/Mrr/RecB family endonuclease